MKVSFSENIKFEIKALHLLYNNALTEVELNELGCNDYIEYLILPTELVKELYNSKSSNVQHAYIDTLCERYTLNVKEIRMQIVQVNYRLRLVIL